MKNERRLAMGNQESSQDGTREVKLLDNSDSPAEDSASESSEQDAREEAGKGSRECCLCPGERSGPRKFEKDEYDKCLAAQILCHMAFIECACFRTRKKPTGEKPAKVARTRNLLVIGLDGAGKSCILERMKSLSVQLDLGGSKAYSQALDAIQPTKGFASGEFFFGSTKFRVTEIGGSEKIRPYWARYLPDAHGIIYVVDAQSSESEIQSALDVLVRFYRENYVAKNLPLLLLFNKTETMSRSLQDATADFDRLFKSCMTKEGTPYTFKVKLCSACPEGTENSVVYETQLEEALRWTCSATA